MQGWTSFRSLALIALLSIPGVITEAYAQVETRRQGLLGEVEQAGDCSEAQKSFNLRILMHGRIAAVSGAFPEALRQRIQNRYKECKGDPFYGENQSKQIPKALEIAVSPNDLKVNCSGGSGNASTWIGSYARPDDEEFWWGGWFGAVHDQLDKQVCGAGENPKDDDCRFAGYPWPFSQAAGIVWHEVMHQQGYGHGANNQAPAKRQCGYTNDPNWHFQRNTMPYIVGQSINRVITRSANRCTGGLQGCPGKNELRMLDSFSGSSCSCIPDPGQKGIGLLAYENGSLETAGIHPRGDRIGGWVYAGDNEMPGIGDFDGNGTKDFILRSGWGIGMATHDGQRWKLLMAKENGTRFGGWRFNEDTDIEGVGDFNGDGADDVIVRSGWGIGILTLKGSTLDAVMMKPKDTWFGQWRWDASVNQGRDTVEGIADLNGDGKADLLVTSSWGVGVLTLAGNSLRSVMTAEHGTRFGGWLFNEDTNIEGLGDFDDVGAVDVVVRSDWGIGILKHQGSTFRPLMMKPKDTWFGQWRWDASVNQGRDTVEGIADLNGDGKADLLLTSSWGVGVLTLDGNTLTSVMTAENGTRFGGWRFNEDTRVEALGDVNGDGADEVVVQSGWGTGVLQMNGSNRSALSMKAHGKLFGSWLLEQGDRIVQVADLSPGAGEEVLLRAPR